MTVAPGRPERAPARITQPLVLGEEWMAWPGLHGGRVMALSAGVAAGLAGGRPLRAMDTRFLNGLRPGPVTAAAAIEHESRTSATVTVRLVQDGATSGLSTCTFSSGEGEVVVPARVAPGVPGAEACVEFREAEALYPFARRLEIRPATDALPLAGGDEAELTAWLRLRSPEPALDTILTLADAMPPAIYALLRRPVPVPSVQISTHVLRPVRAEPAREWLLAQQRNVHTAQGVSVDECDLWDESGQLVAQTRQLRQVIEGATVDGG